MLCIEIRFKCKGQQKLENFIIYKEWLWEYAKTDLLGLNYTAGAFFLSCVIFTYYIHFL